MVRRRIPIRDHAAEQSLFFRRGLVAIGIVVFFFSLLLFNMYYLQIVQFEDYQTRSNTNRIKVRPVAPNRGLIFDRNGKLLAENRTVFNLDIIPEQVDDLPALINKLKQYVTLSDGQITRFNRSVKHNRRFKPITLKRGLNEEEVAKLSVNQTRLPGVTIDGRLARHYPYDNILTHLMGYVARINKRDAEKIAASGESANYAATRDIGKIGIEKYHESLLHGNVGYERVEVNNKGRVLRSLDLDAPTPGKNITLNIDVDMQQIASELLDKFKGAVVVLDAKTGGVMTLVSNPTYSANAFVNGISTSDYSDLLNAKDRPLINRATQGQYPPASTIKPHIGLLGLDRDIITKTTRMYDQGSYKLNNVSHVWRDHLKTGHGWVNLTKSIEVSCDTFFYDLAYRLGIDSINEFMTNFGFGDYTGIDLYEESDGNMPSRGWKKARFNQPWYIGDTIPVGIGQSYWTVTPLQLADSIVTLVNNGDRYVPQIIRGHMEGDEQIIYDKKTLPPLTVNNPANYEVVLDAMYGTLNRKHGTGTRAFRNTNYVAAGKTGTAQLISIGEDDEYIEEEVAVHLRDNAMFVGYAPYKNPEIVIAITLENAGHGGARAAPIARKIMDYYFEHYDRDGKYHMKLAQHGDNNGGA